MASVVVVVVVEVLVVVRMVIKWCWWLNGIGGG